MCTRAVSGLAHYLEREGLPTTAIVLIRAHAALIAPPRALSVPFELGRPFGAPNEPDFQRRVLVDALSLLERTDGPLLVDFPDGPPQPDADLAAWTAPIAAEPQPGDAGALADAVKSEIESLQPLRDQWVREHGGRQLDRITSFSQGDIVDLIQGYTRDQSTENPMPAFPPERTVKYAADDLKHFYYMAGLSKPGRITDIELDNWFFGETLAGELLLRLKAALLVSNDTDLKSFGER